MRYDLLAGMRRGDSSQNPIVKPGDSVTLSPAQPKIKLVGEVKYPGSYELLPGEGLNELVEKFGGGLTDLAETTRIRIDRMTSQGPTAQYIALSKAYNPPISLEGCLEVIIPSRMENQTVVWFEGAVIARRPSEAGSAEASQAANLPVSSAGGATAGSTASAEAEYSRFSIQVYEGEMLSDALKEIKTSLSPSADLTAATLFRLGASSPQVINLQPLFTMANPVSDLPLQPYDRIFIPSLRSTITVNGAVLSGGSFAYQPSSPASYYIGLAGGIDPERNVKGQYWIFDRDGKRRPPEEPLVPGDRIFVPTTSFAYNLVRYTPVVTGIATLIIALVPFVQTYIFR
jgi:polysaccharide biosynthesis/export protein